MRNAVASSILLVFAASVASVVVACGGAISTIPDEAETAPGATGGTATSPTAPPNGTATSTPPGTGQPPPSPTNPPPPPLVDGGPRPSDAGVIRPDTGAPPTISCGTTSCNASTQACCVTQAGGSCIAKGAPCQGGTLACSSKASCTGANVCCGEFSGTSGSATCKPSCGAMGIQLCAVDAECTAPATCEAAFGGLKTCRRGFGP